MNWGAISMREATHSWSAFQDTLWVTGSGRPTFMVVLLLSQHLHKPQAQFITSASVSHSSPTCNNWTYHAIRGPSLNIQHAKARLLRWRSMEPLAGPVTPFIMTAISPSVKWRFPLWSPWKLLQFLVLYIESTLSSMLQRTSRSHRSTMHLDCWRKNHRQWGRCCNRAACRTEIASSSGHTLREKTTRVLRCCNPIPRPL